MSTDDSTPRNVFCYIRRSNRTNKNEMSKMEAEVEKCNQEAFEIATSIDPSFLLTIPNSKTPLNKYLSSSLMLLKEKLKEKLTMEEIELIETSIIKLTSSDQEPVVPEDADDTFFDSL